MVWNISKQDFSAFGFPLGFVGNGVPSAPARLHLLLCILATGGKFTQHVIVLP